MRRTALALLARKDHMGFTKTLIREGNGSKPARGQQVTVHCTGYGKNRDPKEKFWSTKDPGQEPFTFAVGLGQVIKGWDESVINMSIGEVARIHCSPDYAYGAGGFEAWGIMPNSELTFEIEVLSFK
mmetsp:Transcript_18842/g.31248  ORF Transcript_18842/g.31248 Transcript_18842/m.31248 type:complete len:127 (-) Transcript_18842:82-462(-)